MPSSSSPISLAISRADIYTLKSINNLGVLLQAQGDLAAAAPLYREALAGYCEKLGSTHPDTL